ncbi:hypothetical protein A9Q99_05790 [Gammaproteobacteria bacterium 45_16_T64]|nr:hypothetical protein A9Q99_05790 [Gammaproteobacteria bacterium 45_16_T64]
MTEDHWILLASVVIAIVAFVGIFNNIIKARLIEDTPTSKIRSASQGYVELVGVAKKYEDAPIIAPLSGQTCLWYYYKIERYERSGKSSSWRTIETKSSDRYFTLQDETGECSVDPCKADIISRWKDEWRGNERRPTSMLGQESLLFGSRYRYTEHRIHEDDALYALGLFQTVYAPSLKEQKKHKVSEILNEWKKDQDSLLARFDTDGDGEIDLQEWANARKAAAKQAHYYVEQNADNSPMHIMTRSPQRRNPYIVSNKDPKEVSRRYRWIAAGCGLAFAISIWFGTSYFYRLFY